MGTRSWKSLAFVLALIAMSACTPPPTPSNQRPNAVVSAVPFTGPAPLSVDFSASGSTDPDGTITTYAWDFGDGNTSSDATVAHVYSSPGAYVATLTVTDNDGATDSASANIVVTTPGNTPPTASLVADVTSGPAPLAVHFDTTGSSDPDGTIVSRSLDFGDGSPAVTTDTADHTYAAEGTYDAVLTVTDDAGDTGTTTVTIDVAANAHPLAVATATPDSGAAPLDVVFDGTGSSDPDGTVATYAWDFGDGNTGSGPTPTHTYAAVGTYSVELTVTDNGGATGSTTISVDVTTTSISPTSGPAGTTITVTIPCAPTSTSTPAATAMAALVDQSDSSVVATATFDNSSTGLPNAVFPLVVPAGAASGSYDVTTSCDTYMGSVTYPAMTFTVP